MPPLQEPDREPAWRRRKAQRGPEILVAAREVFEESGFEGASLAEVGRRADVSEATVYKYFNNKQDLVRQVIRGWMEPYLEQLERELRLLDSARSRLTFLAGRHLDAMHAAPGLHRLVYRELRWSDYQGSALHRLNQRYSDIVKWIFAEAMASGELRDDLDPRLARDMLFGGLEHVGWRMVFDGQSGDIEAAAHALIGNILIGLAASGARGEDAQHRIVERLETIVERLDAHAPANGPN
jgi:TetR/AcrR family transcriptional regulator, fatty acid metabolism regulator protein